MDEKVVHSLLPLFIKTTPMNPNAPVVVVRILPKAAVQVKKAIRGEAFTFQTLFQGKGEDYLGYNVL
jgi:hypothetical protein